MLKEQFQFVRSLWRGSIQYKFLKMYLNRHFSMDIVTIFSVSTSESRNNVAKQSIEIDFSHSTFLLFSQNVTKKAVNKRVSPVLPYK
jgi:hypothetical protein